MSPLPPASSGAPLPPADHRLRKLGRVAWVLDRSIPIGGGRRIGLDPLLGLFPGIGDWLGAVLSLYVLYEAARLGLPLRVLGRIAANITVEALLGAIPILGDLFDFAWQANMRNLRLVERHYQPGLRPRSLRQIAWALILFALLLLTLLGLAIAGLFQLLGSLIA